MNSTPMDPPGYLGRELWSEMRVLFWSPYSSWGLHACHEVTFAEALRQRGATVHTLLCNALFPECDVHRRNINWTPTGRPKGACEKCQLLSVAQHANADQPFEWLGVYLPRELYASARRFADECPSDSLMSAVWDGRPVGEWARSSAFYQFRMSAFELSNPEVVQSLRDHVYGTILAYEGLRRAWDELQPDVLVTFNGRFFSHRAALELAFERGARVVTHERGMVRDTVWVHLNGTVFDLRLFLDTWETWKDIPLTATEAAQTWKWLDDRRHHRNLSWRPFSPKPQEEARVRSALGLDDRPVVAMFTSSDDEMAAFPERRVGAFPESLDWIPASIALARRMPDVIWVIRMHPNLVGYGQNDQALNQAKALSEDLPENVRLILPTDDISSYTLADMAQIGVVYMTTMGLEMAAKGQRVLAVARGHYGHTDVVDLVVRAEDYEAAVRAALVAPRSMRRAQRTFRFLQRLHREYAVPFPLVVDPDQRGAGKRTWTRSDQLAPGKLRELDRICDTILNGAPTVAPPTPEDRSRSEAAETEFLRRSYPWLVEAAEQPETTEADRLVARGEAHYGSGDLKSAKRSFEAATRLDPNHPNAWTDLGAVQHELHADPEALQAFILAIRLDPHAPHAWRNLILALLDRGRVADARARLTDALGVMPDDPTLMEVSGLVG